MGCSFFSFHFTCFFSIIVLFDQHCCINHESAHSSSFIGHDFSVGSVSQLSSPAVSSHFFCLFVFCTLPTIVCSGLSLIVFTTTKMLSGIKCTFSGIKPSRLTSLISRIREVSVRRRLSDRKHCGISVASLLGNICY